MLSLLSRIRRGRFALFLLIAVIILMIVSYSNLMKAKNVVNSNLENQKIRSRYDGWFQWSKPQRSDVPLDARVPAELAASIFGTGDKSKPSNWKTINGLKDAVKASERLEVSHHLASHDDDLKTKGLDGKALNEAMKKMEEERASDHFMSMAIDEFCKAVPDSCTNQNDSILVQWIHENMIEPPLAWDLPRVLSIPPKFDNADDTHNIVDDILSKTGCEILL